MKPPRLVEISQPIAARRGRQRQVARTETVIRQGNGASYTGVGHRFDHDSQAGTYLDLPAHIRETDDGLDIVRYPLAKLYRVPAVVIHLNRASGSGAVTAGDLRKHAPCRIRGGALVVNALGRRRYDAIEYRSVWLARDAVRWIVEAGVHLLVSDIYESQALHGVFLDLFRGGVATLCHPVRLHRLTTPRVRLTVLPAPYEGATQIPCRAVAELVDLP